MTVSRFIPGQALMGAFAFQGGMFPAVSTPDLSEGGRQDSIQQETPSLALIQSRERLAGSVIGRSLEDLIPENIGANPSCVATHSVAGLVIRPTEGIDLALLAEEILENEPRIPNHRIVLDLCHWSSSPELTADSRSELQRLADNYAISICLKTNTPPFAEVIDPAIVRTDPSKQVPMLAMPEMCLRLHQSLELRQELRLELCLRLVLEIRQSPEIDLDQFYDDTWGPDQVPPQVYEVRQFLSEMARLTDQVCYLEFANTALDKIAEIHEPHFRMMAVCHLGEELSRHPALMGYVQGLYANYFTQSFSATFESEQPTLALMVAASQLRAGMEPRFVEGLVGRALHLAKKAKVEFRGNDSRNLQFILSRWPSSAKDLATAKTWVDDFVTQEYWVPAPGEDILDSNEEPDAVEPTIVPEVQPPQENLIEQANQFVRRMNQEEESFARTRLVQIAMRRLVEERGFNDETFSTLMAVATHDPWEETAVIVYRLLAEHAPFRPSLSQALRHFSDPYYRAKADWVLAEASGGDAEAKRREVQRLLHGQTSLTELQNRHEGYCLGERAEDPLREIVPEGNRLTLPATQGMDASQIERWAASQVADWQAARSTADQSRLAQEQAAAERRRAEAARMRAEEKRQWEEDRERREDEKKKRKEEEKEKSRRQQRREDLYYLIASSLIAHHPDDPAIQISALEVMGEHTSPRILALFMNELPVEIRPEVGQAAEGIIQFRLRKSPYYQTLARILSLRLKHTDYQTKKRVSQLVNDFIKVASEDETVSNAEAIADLTSLARTLVFFKTPHQKILTLARRRLALYQEKIVELKKEKTWRTGSDEDESGVGDETTAWQDLHDQGQAHLLASTSFFSGSETEVRKKIEKINNPFLQAKAYRLRAHMLAVSPRMRPLARECMTLAFNKMAEVELTSVRVGLGMQILEDLQGHPVFKNLEPQFLSSLKNPFAESESARLIALQTHVKQEGWFSTEDLARRIVNKTISPVVLGRLMTPRQFGKFLKRADLTAADQVSLLMGQLKNGLYQGAFETARSLIESEESKPGSEYLDLVFELINALLSLRDSKAKEYLEQRTKMLIRTVTSRPEPAPLTPSEWKWLGLSLDRYREKELLPLLFAQGLAQSDRLRLLEVFARAHVLEPKLIDLYWQLTRVGKEHLFFTILQGIQQCFPGVTLTHQLIDDLLKDPRVRENEENIGSVLASWGELWRQFEDLRSPEERVHFLTTNTLLADRYFRQESDQYDFGDQRLDLKGFRDIVKSWDNLPYRQEHRILERYERALERAHPTTREDRAASLASVMEQDDLDSSAKDFLNSIIQSETPLSEADILRIEEIGRVAEDDHPEELLPPNRQRSYRLYRGEAPVVWSGGFERSQGFVRRFSAREKKGAMSPFELPIQFRLSYSDLIGVLQTDWAIKEINRLIDENPSQGQKRQDLETLIQGNVSRDKFSLGVSRIHTALVAEISGVTLPQARGQIKKSCREYFSGHVLPRLLEEKSHFLASDSSVVRSAQARAQLLKRDFGKFYPSLDEFLAKEASVNDRKTQIAGRLGFTNSWRQSAGDKVLVEAELLADLVELNPYLRENYFTHLRDAMRYQADSRSETIVEKLSRSASTSRGRYEVRYVDKRDIYNYVRIGDYRPCCIATNGMYFKSTMPGFFKDRMTQILAIYDPDSRKVVGHMVGHLGLSGVDEEPTYFLNGLYLRHQHRGESQEEGAFQILADFAKMAGVNIIRHGLNSYHDLTKRPPAGFASVTSRTVRLQSIYDADGKPVPLYNDLGFNKMGVNEPQETTHYHRRVDAV